MSLEKELKNLGFIPGTAGGDGNYLIHTIQQLLPNDMRDWRRAIYNYVVSHNDDYSLRNSVEQTIRLKNHISEDEHVSSTLIEEHILSILRDGEMLGSEAIIAAHHIAKRPLILHVYDNGFYYQVKFIQYYSQKTPFI